MLLSKHNLKRVFLRSKFIEYARFSRIANCLQGQLVFIVAQSYVIEFEPNKYEDHKYMIRYIQLLYSILLHNYLEIHLVIQ